MIILSAEVKSSFSEIFWKKWGGGEDMEFWSVLSKQDPEDNVSTLKRGRFQEGFTRWL